MENQLQVAIPFVSPWSSLKTVVTSNTNQPEAAQTSALINATSKSADDFQKFKMQMKIKEEQHKQLENMRKQKEREQSKENQHYQQQPIVSLVSNASLQSRILQPSATTNLKTITLSSVATPSSYSAQIKKVTLCTSNSASILATNSSNVDNASSSEINRSMSVQEMRESEKRRREQTAGNIDLEEQRNLMTLFEQNFTAPN